MVNAKKKKASVREKTASAVKPAKRLKTSSSRVHAGRARFSCHRGLSDKDKKVFRVSRWVIIGVIVVAMLAVILVIFMSVLNNPENLVKSKIETITADYYENYFYPRVENSVAADKTFDEVMSRYAETGFSRITLKQLLLFDSERYGSLADYLTGYCDPEATHVRIYPDAPFGKSDYHVDYNYACTF